MKRIVFCAVGFAVAGSVLASIEITAQGGIPRLPDRQPDFNGIWVETTPRDVLPGNFDPKTGNFATVQGGRDGTPNTQERDPGVRQRLIPNRPHYKPQHWARVRYLDVEGATTAAPDPIFICLPAGVPRMGPPDQIVQTSNLMIFIHSGREEFRRIYMDGRPHPPMQYWWGTWRGHSVGRWEGDTLVISTVDFNTDSWIGWPGYFHSENMTVTERMTREGNKITWQATVNDPDVLLKPWVGDPITITLNPDPKAEIEETLPCRDRDLEHMFTKERG